MKKLKEFLLSDKMCFGALLASVAMLFTYAVIKDPRHYTISMIGIERPVLFFILCAVMVFATMINMFRYIKKIGYNTKIMRALIWIMDIPMLIAAFTQDFGDSKALAAIHWTTALMFIAVVPLLLLWCGIYRIYKGNKKVLFPVIFFHSIYLADIIVMLYSFLNQGASEGKNGIMELVPLGLTFLILLLCNNTTLFDNEKDKARMNKYKQTNKQFAEEIK